MDPRAIGLIVFACVFGSAFLGMYLRFALPKHHLCDESKDVVRLSMGLVATMAALVLGLMVASAKGAYDLRKGELDRITADLTILDSVLVRYGPETQDIRQGVRRIVARAIERLWPQEATQTPTAVPVAAAEGGNLHSLILRLAPSNDEQRELRSMAADIGTGLIRERWLLVAQEQGNILPVAFLVIVVTWLALLFGSFGLFAPPNKTVVAMIFLSAISVSEAVFLIIELAESFSGVVQISSAPLRALLGRIGQ